MENGTKNSNKSGQANRSQNFNFLEYKKKVDATFSQHDNAEPVVFFGAGKMGKTALLAFKNKYSLTPVLFCDNSPEKQGTFIDSIKVVSIEEMLQQYPECIVILTVSPEFSSTILNQIKVHVKKDKIFEFAVLQRLWDAARGMIHKEQIFREFQADIEKYSNENKYENFQITEEDIYPILYDKHSQAGNLNYYFWQDLWGAKWIYQRKPEHHYDIGSRVDGFIAHLLSFRENIHVIDVRPLNTSIPGVEFTCADATNLEEISSDSLESISALCSMEHFGLGRYGDPVDPSACFKAFDSVQRVLKTGGDLYLSVPIGKERLEFNAHRVFDPKTVVNAFSQMALIELKNIQTNHTTEPVLEDVDNFSGIEGTGLFYFRKK